MNNVVTVMGPYRTAAEAAGKFRSAERCRVRFGEGCCFAQQRACWSLGAGVLRSAGVMLLLGFVGARATVRPSAHRVIISVNNLESVWTAEC